MSVEDLFEVVHCIDKKNKVFVFSVEFVLKQADSESSVEMSSDQLSNEFLKTSFIIFSFLDTKNAGVTKMRICVISMLIVKIHLYYLELFFPIFSLDPERGDVNL